MGSPAGAGGTGQGASVFLPQNQPQAGTGFLSTLLPLFNLSQNAGQGTPAGQNYPGAQNFIEQYLTGSLTGGPSTPFNQYSQEALQGAQQASDQYQSIYPWIANNIGNLVQGGLGGLNALPQLLQNAFNPAYGQAVSGVQNNPYLAQALAGAQQGAGYGGQGAADLFGAGQGLLGQGNNLFSLAGGVANLGNQAWGQASPYLAASQQVLQSGFDPQSALFNRSQQQLMDQANAANAAAGVGNTPYGASTTANALGNFDINWQNNLLNREATAGSAASGLAGTGQGFEGLANNLFGTAGSLAGTGGNLQGLGANMLEQAPGLATQSAMGPLSTYLGGYINPLLSALNSQNSAGIAGATGYGNLLGSAGNSLSTGQNLGQNTAQSLASLMGLPYQTGSGIGNNALSSLSSLTDLGNNQFQLPQQVLNDLESYMGLGQSASALSGQLGQMGFNQLAQGLGGGLSAANSLFGGNGLLSGLGGGGGSGFGLAGDYAGGDAASIIGGGGGGGFLSQLPIIGSLAAS